MEMKTIKLAFNPDYNTIAEMKEVQRVMASLLHRRRTFEKEPTQLECEMFLASFDTLTQGMEV